MPTDLAAALDRRRQRRGTPSGRRSKPSSAARAAPSAPLAVALDRGAQLLAEVVERLLVALQPPRRRLVALVRRGGRGGEPDALEFDHPDGGDLGMGGGEACDRLADGAGPASGWAPAPAPARPRAISAPSPMPRFRGGRFGGGGRRRARRTPPPPARSTTAARAERVTTARRSARPRRSAVRAPARRTAPSPTAEQGGDGEADQEPAPVRDGASCAGAELSRAMACLLS